MLAIALFASFTTQETPKKVFIQSIENKIEIGTLAKNRNLVFGFKNILLENLQELNYDVTDSAKDADYTIKVELLLLAQNRLIFVFVDENGTGWMYGRDYGLMMDTSANKTGKLLADRNGYELVFSGDEKNLAYEVNSTALGTLTT